MPPTWKSIADMVFAAPHDARKLPLDIAVPLQKRQALSDVTLAVSRR
jgi:hypothetical protein